MRRIGHGAIVVGTLAGSDEVIAAEAALDQPASAAVQSVPDPTQNASRGVLTGWDAAMFGIALAVIAMFFWRGWNRLRDAPQRFTAIAPVTGLAFYAAFYLLGLSGAAVAAKAWGIDLATAAQSLHDGARVLLGAYCGQAIVLGLLVYLHVRAPKSPVQSRTNAVKAGAIGLIGVLLSFPVVMAAGGLVAWVIWLVRGEPVDMIAHETLRLFMDNPVDGWYIAMVVMVLIIAPMMEEVMYRGLMQTALVEFGIGRWPAIGVTSAIFALMHAGIAAPHALVALFVFSLGLGCVYERTGRLVAPIVMHAVFNAANFGLALAIA